MEIQNKEALLGKALSRDEMKRLKGGNGGCVGECMMSIELGRVWPRPQSPLHYCWDLCNANAPY